MDKKQKNGFLTANIYQVIIITIVVALFAWLTADYLPPAVDWHGGFRPAALAILRGDSPYNTPGFAFPPWTCLLLLPFAIFPEEVGRALLFIAYLFGVAYTTYKLSGNKVATILILCSPPVMHGLLNGNIDGLVVLGFVLPPWLGLFLLVIKPQLTFAYIIYLFVATFKKEKISGVIKVYAPVVTAYILSLIFFGFWPSKFLAAINSSFNASLWPLSLPIGLVLLTTALRKDEAQYSIMASPFMSPYVLLHSWVVAFIPLATSSYETAAAVIGMWIVFFLRYFS